MADLLNRLTPHSMTARQRYRLDPDTAGLAENRSCGVTAVTRIHL